MLRFLDHSHNQTRTTTRQDSPERVTSSLHRPLQIHSAHKAKKGNSMRISEFNPSIQSKNPRQTYTLNTLDQVQEKEAQFKNLKKDSNWENLTRLGTITRLCALFPAYIGERSWIGIRDRLRRLYYLSREYHARERRNRKQRTDIGSYFLVNRTIRNWNQLSAEALGLSVVNVRFLKRKLGKQL